MKCSAVHDQLGIRKNVDIYDYLRTRLDSNNVIPVFMLSQNYYNSPACLNEMGAVWMKKNEDYFTFLLPGFDFEQIKGAINPRKNAIKLDSFPSDLQGALNDFKKQIDGRFGKQRIDSTRWESVRNKFIEQINANPVNATLEPPHQLIESHLKAAPPNIYIGKKSDIEKRTSIHDLLQGTTELTFVNFASTAFITGPLVDTKYDERSENHWLQAHLTGPDAIKINMVLTNPGSAADQDASRYKMYPKLIPPEIREYFTLSNETFNESNRELHHFIVRRNFNSICDIMLRKKLKNLHIYYTDIALPVGIMKRIYENPALDHIQVNLYLPCIGIDDKRPTFILMENDENTKNVYTIFNDMIRHLDKTRFLGHPDVSFLFNQPIIHRAMLDSSFTEMSRNAVLTCAQKGYPVEVDLLPVAGQFIVARDKEVSIGDSKIALSKLTRKQLDQIRKKSICSEDAHPQIMTLTELLELVRDIAKSKGTEPIPLLLEFKDKWECPRQTIRDNVIRACRIMKTYEKETEQKGQYAFHSANPLVVRYVKDYDIRIPCGWISLDFAIHRDKYVDITEDYRRLHENADCFGGFAYQEERGTQIVDVYYAIPDFVSCKLGDFTSEKSPLRQKCKEFGVKKLGWTAFNQNQYYEALNLEHYDNVLIENFEP